MRRPPLLAAWLALTCLCGTAAAQTAVAPPATAASAPATAASAPASKDAVATTKVIEDDSVRIEETRLRGRPQRISVRIKAPGGSDYEIIVPPGGQDPSQERGTAGRRAWSLFAF